MSDKELNDLLFTKESSEFASKIYEQAVEADMNPRDVVRACIRVAVLICQDNKVDVELVHDLAEEYGQLQLREDSDLELS